MNIKKVEIENYGCIEHFEYSFRKNKDGHAIPLVLIGKNGSGKTLVLANIVDALIEIKRKTFRNILEVADTELFKIGSKNYIKKGANYSRVAIAIEYNQSNLAMYDIMSNTPQDHINDKTINETEISDINEFVENGFSKKIIGKLKKSEYNDFIQLYFPVDRYYAPLWYNDSNYQKISYNASTDINSPKSNIIKVDLLSNVKNWLIDIWMGATFQLYKIEDTDNYPKELRGKTVQIPQYSHLQSIISQLFNIIKGVPCQYTRPNRRTRNVGIISENSNCYDISQLSTGEMYLYGIGLSILKEWDLNHEINDTKEIVGTVIIDEADESLHIDFMYNSLPKLMKLFPNVQFILTAHSPFLLSGLQKEYENDIDIINMPDGSAVTNIDEFSEMIRAFQIFDKEADLINNRCKQLSNEYYKLQSQVNEIFIVTEWKTDIKHIKNAFYRLYGDNDEIVKRIQYFDFATNETLGDELIKNLKIWAKAPNACTIIAIFDRDKRIFSSNGKNFESLGNNVYCCNIPYLENSEHMQSDAISIEHYYTNAELSTDTGNGHLYQWGDFDKYGTSNDKCWSIINYAKNKSTNKLRIIDKHYKNLEKKSDDAKMISKDEFAQYVIEHPDIYNVDNFSKIYDLIKRIIEEVGNN